MIEIKNKIIPFSGYKALTVWPLLFVRSDNMDEKDYRHEAIHGYQQVEMLPIAMALCCLIALVGCGWWSLLALPLYLWVYICLWVYAFVMTSDFDRAYKENPLEKEAYFFEGDEGYLERRRLFGWTQFLKRLNDER